MDFFEAILNNHKRNDWSEVLRLNEKSDDKSALRVLWVWPSEANLNFVKEALFRFGMEGVTSLGCGCGLLEWIIQAYTGLPVIGFEINKAWWESKYSLSPFIPLKYADEEKPADKCNSTFALLFCYFNDNSAFKGYVQNYRGKMIIIIGPGDGSGRHADPQPFSANFDDPKWQLIEHQEVKNTKDFIAIYVKMYNI